MFAGIQVVRRRWPKSQRSAVYANKRSSWRWEYEIDSAEAEISRIVDLNGIEEGIFFEYEEHGVSNFSGQLAVNVVNVDRYHFDDPRKVPIKLNSWIQIIHNFRETDMKGHWFFGEYRLSIGAFGSRVLDAFVTQEPARKIDLRTHKSSVKPFS